MLNCGKYLTQVGPIKVKSGGVICLALAHNEGRIIAEFLAYYRSFGQVSFLIVDDHSNDGSAEYLKNQPDVTLFQPVAGSSYSRHKKRWRSNLLDSFAENKWCLVPDIDEHFVFLDIEKKPLAKLIDELEQEGSEALFSLMIDMYADKPLKDHFYQPDRKSELRNEFPFFDGQANSPYGYRLMSLPSSFRKKYPTPRVAAYGGLRDRLFSEHKNEMNYVQKLLLRNFAHLRRPINPKGFSTITNALTRLVCKKYFSSNPYNSTKLILIRWQKGLEFSGGAHSVNKKLAISNKISAVLHYKFAGGISRLEYASDRGQHAGGSLLIKRILDEDELLKRSPVYAFTKKYENSHSLSNLLR